MNLKFDLQDFRVAPGKKVNLAKWRTKIPPFYSSKESYRDLLGQYRDDLKELQSVLYAHDRYSLLLIFQGMDTSGKDGAIRHVMSGVDPQGCQVYSFKQPNNEELDHDFLWRTNTRLPERGRIGIFNRSYYEEVLVARVVPEVLERQRVPEEFINPNTLWKERFQDIVNMEDYLHRNGTRIVKFFLHISKEEQRQRFLARIDQTEKNWKFERADLKMRERWDEFQSAYADCLQATSTEKAPWYIVPADDKKNARLIISHVVVETLKTLKMSYPKPTEEHRSELKKMRKILMNEEKQ